MRTSRSITTTRMVAALSTAALLLAGCGGATVNSAASPSASTAGSTGAGGSTACAPFTLALNDWVGYTADAAVVSYVAETELGCKVTQTALKEEIAWQGFGNGQVDVVIENWGHPDLTAKYIDQQKVAENAGPTGNLGVIGWFVPPWMVTEHPDITDWNNLNKYADLFKTSESGDKGQLLDGDPSFVTNDEALVTNLGLDFKVVYAGSEAALITAFANAEKNRTPLLGYFYSPQWFLAEVPLVKVDLPPYTDGCDADPEKIACDYPGYTLDKIVSTTFANSASPAADLVKKFSWTNDDQNLVAKYITADKMTPADAAAKWVGDNPDKVKAWLS